MKTAVGLNTLANRLSVLNDQIPLDLLNQNIGSFKLKCKELLLKPKEQADAG